MAVRPGMNAIVNYTNRLVNQATEATPPWTREDVQEALDQNRTWFEWLQLDHDRDYRYYFARPLGVWSESTFDQFYTAGFFEGDYELREGRDITQPLHSPDIFSFVDGVFQFVMPPEIGLYVFAKGYNVYKTALQLLDETPDTGRGGILKRVRRLNTEHEFDLTKLRRTYEIKAGTLNMRRRRLFRS